MTLIDATDSVVMLGAHGWAFVKPIRTLYYNMAVTAASVVVGGLKTINLVGDKFGPTDGGGFCGAIGTLNDTSAFSAMSSLAYSSSPGSSRSSSIALSATAKSRRSRPESGGRMRVVEGGEVVHLFADLVGHEPERRRKSSRRGKS
jgi:hypothetical protein